MQNTYFQYILCNGGGTFRRPPFRRRRLGAADSALDNSAPSRFDAGHFGAVSYIYFFSSYEAGNFLNAVEREPVETRVLNPIASEASYKPKQRSYRTTNPKKKFWRRIVPVPKYPAPNCPPLNRRRRNVPDPIFC